MNLKPKDSQNTDTTAPDEARQFLTEYLDAQTKNTYAELDRSTLRYAIYARKSTLGDERQEKSIEDQITECMERIVKPRGLKLLSDPVIEKGSAKEAGIRPKFAALLNEIKEGRLDGIICWHPDRLARNMKDAGEIIDLIDQGRLVDLQFATFNFENTPNGKMLLGITFVLSKAYSENLSTNVTRGNTRRLLDEGKYLGKVIHGYIITTTERKIIPDGANFTLIQNAFQMRLEGATMTTIAKYLNDNAYTAYHYGKGHSPFHWDKTKVEEMLKKTVYCGAAQYGESYVWLDEYYDFIPAIAPDEFLKMHRASDLSAGIFKLKRAPRDKVHAELYRNMVLCAHCNETMSAGITSKGDKQRFYYRCETSGCDFQNKSTRPKVIIDYMVQFLREHQFTTESNYQSYLKSYDAKVSQRHVELGSTIRSFNKLFTEKQSRLENIKTLVADPNQRTVAAYYTEDLKRLSEDIMDLERQIKDAKRERETLKAAAKSYPEYLELHQKAPDLLLTPLPLDTLDRIGKNFFSNFVLQGELVPPNNKITRWKVVSSELKEPYAGFLKYGDFNHGRGERT